MVVVGAGIAGLAAADSLRRAGVDCVVLEGRERIGGRIWTDRALGDAVDLGAALIHRHKGNPISRLARSSCARLFETDFTNEALYDFDGTPIPPPVVRPVYAHFERLLKRAKSLSRSAEKDLSIARGLELAGANAKVSALTRRVFQRAEISKVLDTGEDFKRLSLQAYDEDGEFDGPDALVKGGYAQILPQLARGLDIRLGQCVRKISMSAPGQALVTTDKAEFSARAVLVTLPLGVLKARKVVFEPALPVAKLEAIRRIGVGSLNKIVLRFDEVFWPPKKHYISHASKRAGEYPEFMNQFVFSGEPILVGLWGGGESRRAELRADAELVAGAMRVLKKMFGKNIPPPLAHTITRWDADPFACGAYCHLRTGDGYDLLDALATPIDNTIFFAGEATHREFPNTVHGAYLSGLREAGRIDKVSHRNDECLNDQ